MQFSGILIALFAILFVIVLAAKQMGEIFARFKLPLISGFLFVGILVGPFVLDIVHTENIPSLLFLDEIALAFIAFAAGAELEWHIIQGYFRSIISLIAGQSLAVMAFGVGAFFLISDRVPFMAGLPQQEILAIALLGATIMIARSPSSALAIIKELRARGPFTHKVLGATVLTDAVVIIIFAASVSVAAVLMEGAGFELGLVIFVIFEIFLDIALGIMIGFILQGIMWLPFDLLKALLVLMIGLAVFTISGVLHDFHLFSLPVGLFSEPLLICMTAGFIVTNFSRHAANFRHIIEIMSPAMFLLFFTLVGIELELELLLQSWTIVLFLFLVRALGIFLGSLGGVRVARDHTPGNTLLGLGFITQAGVSIGLAKEVGVEFTSWGAELATLSIGVIVLGQIVGPPLLKWAVNRVGESHTRADRPEFDGERDVLIFGIEDQSLALARLLKNQDWNAVVVSLNQDLPSTNLENSPQIRRIPAISVAELNRLNTGNSESVVLMLSDEENLAICELVYEHFGVKNLVVRLQNHSYLERFHELGALVVEPGTAMVSLLDQFVRSPFAASLLLGSDPDEVFIELEMRNPDLAGVAIRDLYLPHDVLILSILRKGNRLVSHGYTRLKLGDQITAVGSPDSLAEVQVKFES